MPSTLTQTEIREDIEWVSFRWHNEPERALPRVLLVGDSIVVGHGAKVHQRLKDRLCVDYFATSKHVTDQDYLGDLEFMMARRRHDLVVFNNGLHGMGIDDELYAPALRHVLTLLKDRTPRLAWRTCTPVLEKDGSRVAERTPRVLRRNADARAIADALGLPVLDLYTPMLERKHFFRDGTHCTDEGADFQADRIAAFIREQMRCG